MADFNKNIVAAITLDYRQLFLNSDYVSFSELDQYSFGLGYSGYEFVSVSSNLGFCFLVLFGLSKFLFVLSNILLFFAKTRNRCWDLRLRRQYVSILENISTPSYFNFEMSSSIIQLTGAFVYLRFAKSYYYQDEISATDVLHHDMFLAILSLLSPVYLSIHLMVTAHEKGWFLRKNTFWRKWYPRQHQELMKCVRVENTRQLRLKLTILEKFFNKEEDRFGELS